MAYNLTITATEFPLTEVHLPAGALVHLTDKLNAGVHVYNPVGGKLGKESDEKLASAYKLGMGYDASDNFYFSAEIIKEEDKEVNVTGGLQYHFKKQFNTDESSEDFNQRLCRAGPCLEYIPVRYFRKLPPAIRVFSRFNVAL